MTNTIALAALATAAIFGIIAIVMILFAEYLFAGISFLIVAITIYVYEITKE